jgi:hypothetical protein
MLSNLLILGFRNWCQSLSRSLCLISIGQSFALSVSVCFGIVSLKNSFAASVSFSVLRETFIVNLSLMRCPKLSQFVVLLLNPLEPSGYYMYHHP